VLSSREDKRLLEQAIVEHEAKALVTGEASTPGPSRTSRSRKSARKRTDHQGIENQRDLSLRPPTFRVPRLPRNIGNVVVWDVVKVRSIGNSNTSGITEANNSVSLSTHPQASSWAALFDQFCIPQFSVTWYPLEPPSSTGTTLELHTAIDFDNVSNLGSIAALDDFGSAQVDVLIWNKRVTRSCQPCFKSTASGTASAAVQRGWLDTATPAISHYGIRAIFAAGITAAQNFTIETTVWYAFRNSI